MIMMVINASLWWVLKPQYHSEYKDSTHEENDTLGGIFITGPLICTFQMFIALLYMHKSFLNVKINPINEGPLLYNQLIEIAIYTGELVDRLHQFLNPYIPLIVLIDLVVGNEHLKVVAAAAHLLPVLCVELYGVVDGALFVGFESLEVLLLLISQLLARLADLMRQWHLHVAIILSSLKQYISTTLTICPSSLEFDSNSSLPSICSFLNKIYTFTASLLKLQMFSSFFCVSLYLNEL